MNLQQTQSAMHAGGIDGWLLVDFRGSNSVFGLLMPNCRGTTRRMALFIPARGEPTLLAHGIDGPSVEGARGVMLGGTAPRQERYLTWRDWQAWLSATVSKSRRIAMEYSPGCALPVIAMVDAGTIEMIRAMGVEVASSADLVQSSVAVWSSDGLRAHERASQLVGGIMREAFGVVREALRAGRTIDERGVQRFVLDRFAKEGLETPDGPIVAVNEHSGDPHFEVAEHGSSPIRPGDWILIDMWARLPGDANIFSDITWVGFAGERVPTKHREVFGAVRAARDASLQLAQRAWRDGRTVQGWELDEAARGAIIEAGYERAIKHRTGHSLSPGTKVHGVGMNLDNLETRDTRTMLGGTGFTIEPGVYLPEFGVRLEINVYVDPSSGPRVTSVLQHEPESL